MGNIEELENIVKELQKEIDDLKKKRLVRWRAKKDENYYMINSERSIYVCSEDDTGIADNRYRFGNYFKTRKQAELVQEKILIYSELKDLALELNARAEIDWKDADQVKFHILIDSREDTLYQASEYIKKSISGIYCLDRDFLETAKKRIGEKRLKKLFMEV